MELIYAHYPQDLKGPLSDAFRMWQDIYKVIKYAKRVLLYGPPGTGKSRACSVVGMEGRPLERTAITYETCWPELRGGPWGPNMSYLDGPAVRAWRIGARWVVDEFDQAGGDTIPGLHMIADDADVARLTLPHGETIRPHENFQFFATTNQDPKSLPEALQDRFVLKRLVPCADPVFLNTLPESLRVAAAYSLYSQNGSANATANKGLTTRSWVELGRLMTQHDLSMDDACGVLLPASLAKEAAFAIQVAGSKMAAGINRAADETVPF